MKTIEVLNNQTILDVAVMYYGTLEAIGEILLLNPDIKNDPAEVIASGQEDLTTFYFDIKLKVPQMLIIDDENRLINKNTLKKVNKPVTTYDHGTLDTDN